MTCSRLFATALVLAALATSAAAERATDLLDDLETELREAEVEFALDTTKLGRKKRKTAKQGLGKLSKDTTTETGDVKLLKKLAGAVLKRFDDDPDIVQSVVDAADEVDAGIVADLDAARARVPAGKKLTAAKVSKLIDRAQALLEKSRTKTTKARISVLFKARVAADKAFGKAQQLEPPEPTEPPVVNATSYLLTLDDSDVVRLMAVDHESGARSSFDTGTGEIALRDPRPQNAPDDSTGAFRQADRLVFVNLVGEVTTAGTTVNSGWEQIRWSPDSSMLAAAGREPDTLAVFDPQGTPIRTFAERVIQGVPEEETLLWSPDSSLLAFRTDRDTNGARELRVLDPATGTISELTGALTTDSIRYVAWAPGSDQLVYPADELPASTDVELVVVNADGTGRMAISQPGEDVRDAGASNATVSVNPTRSSVLYEFRSDGTGYLGVVGLDGTSPATIATAGGNTFQRYEWSPDGRWVAYLDGLDLFTYDLDTGDTATIVGNCRGFTWAPDGSALLYREGFFTSIDVDLWQVEPDGSDPVKLSPDFVGPQTVEPFYDVAAEGGVLRARFVVRTPATKLFEVYEVRTQDDGAAKFDGPAKRQITISSRIVSFDLSDIAGTPFASALRLSQQSIQVGGLATRSLTLEIDISDEDEKRASSVGVCEGLTPLTLLKALYFPGVATRGVDSYDFGVVPTDAD